MCGGGGGMAGGDGGGDRGGGAGEGGRKATNLISICEEAAAVWCSSTCSRAVRGCYFYLPHSPLSGVWDSYVVSGVAKCIKGNTWKTRTTSAIVGMFSQTTASTNSTSLRRFTETSSCLHRARLTYIWGHTGVLNLNWSHDLKQ